MGTHRNHRAPAALQPDKFEIIILNSFYAVFATTPTRYDDPSRLIGVDRLTARVLEARAAVEACRA